MKKKSLRISKTFGISTAVAIAGVTAGSLFFPASGNNDPLPIPHYTVERVVDGDTFVTEEKQIIRLAAADSPEISFCGGEESKKALEKLIIGKPVYIKVVYNDKYHRLISLVYTKDTFVNEAMIIQGHADVVGSQGISDKLKFAAQKARQEQIGIFSPRCTQRINSKKSSCNIKGNDGQTGQFYYLPDCGMYEQVDVKLYRKDRWFCTVQEAKKAGFRPPSQCPGK